MSEQRPTKTQLLAALGRLDRRRHEAINAAVMRQGSLTLPRFAVRDALRRWFGEREDLINELWRGWE